jgi:hypothetical protein
MGLLDHNLETALDVSTERFTVNQGSKIIFYLFVVKALCYKPEGRGFHTR